MQIKSNEDTARQMGERLEMAGHLEAIPVYYAEESNLPAALYGRQIYEKKNGLMNSLGEKVRARGCAIVGIGAALTTEEAAQATRIAIENK